MEYVADEILCHILSFLPTKVSASTSVLSKRWRKLFALTPTLVLHDDQELGCAQSFINFVDRVLTVLGDLAVKNISIKSRKNIDTGHVTRWMNEVIKRGVVTLDIDIVHCEESVFVPIEIFTWKTIVELRLAKGFDAMIPDHVFLPSLKTLFLDSVYFSNTSYCALGKLLSACPVLEEFAIHGGTWQDPKYCCMLSSTTLKKLTIMCTNSLDLWYITFDTPNLAYLKYSDLVPRNYPLVNLESLVEAKLDLDLTDGTNPTNLIKGLSNVEVLELSSGDTSEVFYYFRQAIPVFNNLRRLTITVGFCYNSRVMPILLKKSPNLHTLVIKGPLDADNLYVSLSPVKVLKITQYGGKIGELEQVKRFLQKLTCLELVKVRAFAVGDEEKFRITKDLQMVPKSFKCNIKIKFLRKLNKA